MKLRQTLWTALAMLLFATSLSLAGAQDVAAQSSDGVNVAPDGVASQSSFAFGGVADLAIDENTDGAFSGGSVTHTAHSDHSPWFQVELNDSTLVEKIVVHNRTDCCTTRLSNFTVLVSPTPFEGVSLSAWEESASWFEFHAGAVGNNVVFDVGATGKYVRVYKDTRFLALAEVEIFGTPFRDVTLTGAWFAETTTAPRQVSYEWDSVDDATSYEVRWWIDFEEQPLSLIHI